MTKLPSKDIVLYRASEQMERERERERDDGLGFRSKKVMQPPPQLPPS